MIKNTHIYKCVIIFAPRKVCMDKSVMAPYVELNVKCKCYGEFTLIVTDRWQWWGQQQQSEDLLEGWTEGRLGHPHTWSDAAAGVWRLLLHERYLVLDTHTCMWTCCSLSLATVSDFGKRETFLLPCVLVFLVLCPKRPVATGCTPLTQSCSSLWF